jgi:ABC-type glucose/galactose transport system permease subunit
MLNYIALALVNFFVFAVWSENGFQMSEVFPKNAWLPRLTDFGKEIPLFRGLTTHAGLIFALIAAAVVWYILYRSLWGYEIRLIGDNPRAAEYAGISMTRNANQHLTRLWVYRHYHCLVGKVESDCRNSGCNLIRWPHPGRARDSTCRSTAPDSRHHSVYADRK